MTQEQDAANWRILQQYKQLRAEKDQREAMAKNWGCALVSVGEPLACCGGIITRLDLSKLPERTAMQETQRELSLPNDQIASLRKELQRVGLSEFL